MNATEAKAAVEKYGGQRAAERVLKLSRGTICNALKRGFDPDRVGGKKTLADFRSAHDRTARVLNKIRMAIVALGKDGWEYEGEFARSAGVSTGDISHFRDKFKEFTVEIPKANKRAWAGSPELAKQMKELL